MNDHPDEQRLQKYLTDSLSAADEESVGSHLSNCAVCQSKVEQIIGATFSLQYDEDTKSPVAGTSGENPNLGTRFMVLNELARGGMGVVYRGFDREFQRIVAIKVSMTSDDTEMLARFQREAQISGQLQHPGIVPVHHLGRMDDGRFFMAMKLVEGQTLLELIREEHSKSKPDTAKLLDIFGSVCQTTAYAHSSNFIHRDLKPANVMVGTFGEVQVMDWGLAKKLSSSDGEMFDTAINGNGSDFKFTLPGATQVGDVFGTPAYMSPEQVRGEESDKRSDVFTLGGILFQILTGKAPFPRGRSKKKTGVTEEALAQLDQVEADAELLALLRSCLAEDPADRPLDAQQVSQRFANFLAGRAAQFEEAKLEKARATERLIAQQKRNKQLLWSGGVVLATVIASAVAGYMYLAEKNVRIADQARVETENIERKFNHESQIRSNIDAAKVYSLAAVQNPLHQRHTDWTLALKEVEKAVPLVSESIDPELRTEFLEFERSVRSETAFALRNKKHHDEEAACAKELFPLREHVFYPEDMRLCKMVYLAPQFEAVFKRLGVEPGVFSRDAISRITGSEFKIELIHGLMSWQQETELFLVYNDLHIYDTPELNRLHDWLVEFIKRVDPDPLRIRLRAIGMDLENEKLALLKTDEAVASLLTVYSAAEALNSSAMPDSETTEYLLRAHQKYPKDFFVNWWLPVMAGGSENQEAYALACYSLRPDNPAVLIAYGNALINGNEPERAIEPLERLKKIAPWYVLGHSNLELAYGKTGQFEKAEAQNALAKKAMNAARERFLERAQHYRNRKQERKADALEKFVAKYDPDSLSTPEPNPAEPPELSPETIAAQEKLVKSIASKKADIIGEPDYPAQYGRLRFFYDELCKLLTEAGRPDLIGEVVDRAIEDFQEVGKLTEIQAPYENLATFCEEHDRLGIAIESLREASARVPDYRRHKDHLIKLHNRFCDQLITTRQPSVLNKAVDDALKDMRQISDDAPKDSDFFHKRMARFAEKHRRFDDAVVGYRRSFIAEPEYDTWRFKLSDTLLLAGQAHEIAGRSEQANESFEAAVKLNREWVARDPENKTAHERLCVACDRRGFFAEAMEHKGIAIGIVPHYTPHHDHFAKLAVKLSQQQKLTDIKASIETLTSAIDFLKEFEVERTHLAEPHNVLSQRYAESGDYDLAIAALEFVIEAKPGDQLLRERLAELYVSAKQPDEAEAILLELKAASPSSDHVIQLVAEFYVEQGKLDQAASVIKEAQKEGVNSPGFAKLRSAISERLDNSQVKAEQSER